MGAQLICLFFCRFKINYDPNEFILEISTVAKRGYQLESISDIFIPMYMSLYCTMTGSLLEFTKIINKKLSITSLWPNLGSSLRRDAFVKTVFTETLL